MHADLREFIDRSRRLVVLTGAGCSTDSGIPDYRSPGGAWTRHKPIQYGSFVRSAEVRRFCWARSYRGWPRFAGARPNRAHVALAGLEERGKVHQLITQNVDDLHQEAGSRAVVQLHGRNRLVLCLGADLSSREKRCSSGWPRRTARCCSKHGRRVRCPGLRQLRRRPQTRRRLLR